MTTETTEVGVILVAGVGSRLRPLTDDRPKALVEVGDETMLGRAVRLLLEHGVRELVLATGYREDAVRAARHRHRRGGTPAGISVTGVRWPVARRPGGRRARPDRRWWRPSRAAAAGAG
ncbi:MAG: hypothetical protein EOO74_02190 [Myxococcales bacterium]|nr:MAG: hypothetical protein EOO74_02190 [Myxococcales bacterium]